MASAPVSSPDTTAPANRCCWRAGPASRTRGRDWAAGGREGGGRAQTRGARAHAQAEREEAQAETAQRLGHVDRGPAEIARALPRLLGRASVLDDVAHQRGWTLATAHPAPPVDTR